MALTAIEEATNYEHPSLIAGRHTGEFFDLPDSVWARVPDTFEVTVLREPPRYGVGVAEPKAWAWFVRRAQDDGRVLNEGLVRMAFFQGNEFHITHYSSPAELEAATRWAYPEPVEAWLADYLGFSR